MQRAPSEPLRLREGAIPNEAVLPSVGEINPYFIVSGFQLACDIGAPGSGPDGAAVLSVDVDVRYPAGYASKLIVTVPEKWRISGSSSAVRSFSCSQVRSAGGAAESLW